MPSFGAPPVVEVALSVGFEAVLGLGTVNLARLSDEYRLNFPTVEEQAPYVMPLESFGKPTSPSVSLELFSIPPAPRLWFVDTAGAHLVQVQNNWFARNWRKAPSAPEYPRYPKLSRAFRADLEIFRAYLRREGLGEIRPTQCEVTYINHIEWPDPSATGNVGAVLGLIVERPQGFGLRPESQQVNSSYRVDHDGSPVGRVHVSAGTARRVVDNVDIVLLNITVRGVPIGKDLEGVVKFHRLGREWAMQAFLGLTRDRMHEIWRMVR